MTIIKNCSTQMNTLEEFQLADYEVDRNKILGQGGYGKIYQAFSVKSGKDVAIKQIDLEKVEQENEMESLYKQIQIMERLKSPYIVQLIEYRICKKYAYLVLQFCTNDLRKQMINKKTRFTEQQSIIIFEQIIKGVKVLVQNSLVHRDLKPENILVRNSVYKITDFGFTKQADLHCNQKLEDICGTPIYMAPQLLDNKPYTAKCDIWSLGLILYEMIYGSTPWPIKCISNYLSMLHKRPLAFAFDVRIGKQTKDFIKKALTIDEEKRMTWKQLFEHPFIKNKISGQIVIPPPFNFKVRKILSKMQRQTKRKFINVIEVFSNFEDLTELSLKQFNKLMKELNPTISSHQIRIIFEACDKNGNGKIEKNEFREMFCGVNYHEFPQVEKQIDEIIGIICMKEVEVKDLFEQFDSNKSGSLSRLEFRNMIKHIAPAYQIQLMDAVFNIMDSNHDGFISKREFVNCIGGGLINQKHYVGLWVQKATRNLKTLKGYLAQKNLNALQIVKLVDANKDKHLDIKQFTKLMQIINFNITSEEVLDIFRVLDNDCSGKISMKELQNYIE